MITAQRVRVDKVTDMRLFHSTENLKARIKRTKRREKTKVIVMNHIQGVQVKEVIQRVSLILILLK